ncbi:MAG: [FeFe] hydrogenase H-cluster radical SAM maturase HydE [Lachnospiraceae bacterium]
MRRQVRLIEQLMKQRQLSEPEWIELFSERDSETEEYLYQCAVKETIKQFGKKIFIRGLIEISSYCRNDCYYCGIRKSNEAAERYRLTKEEILSCCENGYSLGFRTFVLQGGEDGYFTDERMEEIIREIHKRFPDCAITLSLGERERESYQRFFKAGANRYLLRHETADANHYQILHPNALQLEHRLQCLKDLKEIGYQTGCGMMIGSPGQTPECLAKDMVYMKKLNPQMVGIGPFIPHRETPFAKETPGNMEDTVYTIALIRLMLPNVLLPATTALATIAENGREKGILAGANVIMPNLSPVESREKYSLYNNKKSSGGESAEGLELLKEQMKKIEYEIVTHRGDYKEESYV